MEAPNPLGETPTQVLLPRPALGPSVSLAPSKLMVKPFFKLRVSFKKLSSGLWDVTSLLRGHEHLGTLASFKTLSHP